jgi:hypothetical protein
MGIAIYKSDIEPPPAKRQRNNPIGQDVYLLPDGAIKRDEDTIIITQRLWKHEAYKPGGVMYNKAMDRLNSSASSSM